MDERPLLLSFWPLLPLLSPRPSPRLMPTPTFSMEDMVWDTLVMLDTLAVEDTMDIVKLKLSPRLLPTPTFCMVDMDILDMLDMVDTMDLDTDFMESALLMPSQKL